MSPQEAIKMLRAEIGLTQIELAAKLHIGFTTLNRWENGKAIPNRVNSNNIIRTARELGVSEVCLAYLNNVLFPSRMRGRTATELGFPELDRELLCQMVDGSSAGVVLIDEETKKLIYVNRKAEELCGTSYFAEGCRYCWGFLKGNDKPCADCDAARFPLMGYCDRTDVSPGGLKLQNRTRSIIWKGKKVYVVYMFDATELNASRTEVQTLIGLFPAGVGVFYVYHDGRFEMADAYYHQLDERGTAQKIVGANSVGSIYYGDLELLQNEVRAAIAENRDVDVQIRGRIKGHWIQLFARQFAQDEEKRMFLCSFVDVDRHMREMKTAENA